VTLTDAWGQRRDLGEENAKNRRIRSSADEGTKNDSGWLKNTKKLRNDYPASKQEKGATV